MTFNFYDRVLASSLEARFRGPNPLHYGMELGAGDGSSNQKLGFFRLPETQPRNGMEEKLTCFYPI